MTSETSTRAGETLEVLVVGAGPTGLMLGVELAMRGVRVAVIDRRDEPATETKGSGVNARTCEILAMRGLWEEAQARSLHREGLGGHFGVLPVVLDASAWSTRHNGGIMLPQHRTEAILEERLHELGTRVERGTELLALEVSDALVTAEVSRGGRTRGLAARYLVACDGARSTVRGLTGTPFPGSPGVRVATSAEVEMVSVSDRVQEQLTHASLQTVSVGGYQMMMHTLGETAPGTAGAYRVMFSTAAQQEAGRDAGVTLEEVALAVSTVYGAKTRVGRLRSASRFTDAARLLDDYRHRDRVFFAGDAAHIHPPYGGQGLNLGLQDAFNLGWKLAAAVRGAAAADLLDSYTRERRPVASRVIATARAQGILMPLEGLSEEVIALRDIVSELANTPEANRLLTGRMSGLDIRYETGGCPHPLAGMRMPDLELDLDGRRTTVSALLRSGDGLLLSLDDSAAPPAGGRVQAHRGRVLDSPAGTVDAGHVLVRPDGYVCWAGGAADEHFEEAMRTWFAQQPSHAA
ncbi:FAD-dependent oxidoreductase [Streptomyces sp. NPDC001228]|uniref:FAD-dependent oxidoreductase n=1 Tax=Streptomyces sp. NPDC001228 TaxID=3154381 RepID=UPI0033278608